jgi:hypothetical protein
MLNNHPSGVARKEPAARQTGVYLHEETGQLATGSVKVNVLP